ncbi:MAG TPA: hypothetical protein VMM82_15120, partial [Spirochaetia bacterium]|nr:hypothetical protein [Spirochaetia bacterium]
MHPRSAGKGAFDFSRRSTYHAVRSMKQVTIRLDLRVSEEMNEFILSEAHSRKLSFEGLILMLIEEQMKRVKQESQRISPPRP